MNGRLTNWLLGIIASLVVTAVGAGVVMFSEMRVMRSEMSALRRQVEEANEDRWPRSQAELLWQRQALTTQRQDTLTEALERRLDDAERYLERLKERDRLAEQPRQGA